MAINTYSTLQTALANWLHHSNLTDRIQEFIALAEAMINDEVEIKEMQLTDDTLTASTSSRFVTLPTGFNKPEELEITYSSQIWYPEYVDKADLKKHRDTTDGPPGYYTVWGSQLEFERVPDYAYSMTLDYFGKVSALSDAAPTNDVLTNYPDIYLYGSLVAGEPYLVNDERFPLWLGMYEKCRDRANLANRRSRQTARPKARAHIPC